MLKCGRRKIILKIPNKTAGNMITSTKNGCFFQLFFPKFAARRCHEVLKHKKNLCIALIFILT
jgi:hypothetical protein